MRSRFLFGVAAVAIVSACSGTQAQAPGGPGPLAETVDAGEPVVDASTEPATPEDAGAPLPTVWTADNCLAGQDMDAEDVDVSHCPPLPEYPEGVKVGSEMVSLGAWEIGTTASGETYKYGGLTASEGGPTILSFEGGTTEVNAGNVLCWSKAYYRLRKILQDPPREWLALRAAHFQYRFFQFQTDLRNGSTGFKKISSYQDHLVKWVAVITTTGVCQQPTLSKFRSYAAGELTRRGLPLPGSDGGSAGAR